MLQSALDSSNCWHGAADSMVAVGTIRMTRIDSSMERTKASGLRHIQLAGRARIFHARRSSRREEAPISVAGTAIEILKPPHVGCYGLGTLQSARELCGIARTFPIFPSSLSLAPGFSPVNSGGGCSSRFNGFLRSNEAAEAAPSASPFYSPG